MKALVIETFCTHYVCTDVLMLKNICSESFHEHSKNEFVFILIKFTTDE